LAAARPAASGEVAELLDGDQAGAAGLALAGAVAELLDGDRAGAGGLALVGDWRQRTL
jgi:hypothetical protein